MKQNKNFPISLVFSLFKENTTIIIPVVLQNNNF